jgi:hypothetical protein
MCRECELKATTEGNRRDRRYGGDRELRQRCEGSTEVGQESGGSAVRYGLARCLKALGPNDISLLLRKAFSLFQVRSGTEAAVHCAGDDQSPSRTHRSPSRHRARNFVPLRVVLAVQRIDVFTKRCEKRARKCVAS